jgi:UDP-N-acetylmuramyl pentapeptide phosphotransferase/UDP-N-acetylglucosamine-1-phosphate transferase
MLGDTGANAFGAVLGLAGALYFSPGWQAAVVVALAAFQVWCERYSLSRTIERHPVLRRLDRKIGVR